MSDIEKLEEEIAAGAERSRTAAAMRARLATIDCVGLVIKKEENGK